MIRANLWLVYCLLAGCERDAPSIGGRTRYCRRCRRTFVEGDR